jgi:hypothetical protein
MQNWKPSPRWAALLAEPAPSEEPAQHEPYSRGWGFGARGANKAWTSPQEKPLPKDYFHTAPAH